MSAEGGRSSHAGGSDARTARCGGEGAAQGAAAPNGPGYTLRIFTFTPDKEEKLHYKLTCARFRINLPPRDRYERYMSGGKVAA